MSCGEKAGKAGYSDEDLTGKVEILRDKQTKSAVLRIDTPGQCTLYAGPSVETIDFSATWAATAPRTDAM